YWLYNRDPLLLEESERLALRALELKPDAWPAYQALSHVYRLQGKLEEAEVAAKAYVEAAPDKYQSHFALGLFYAETGRLSLAVAPYERAIELEPTVIGSYWNMIVLSDRLNDSERVQRWSRAALPVVEQRLRLFPDDESSLICRASFLQRIGETDRAIEA